MIDHLKLPVLVLNKGWQPIAVASVRRSIVQVMSNVASFLDDNYNLHDIDGWLGLSIPRGCEAIGMTRGGRMRIPEIMVLANYERFPIREVKLTRRNLMVRDRFKCQYTGEIVSSHNATMDHVVPQSAGGRTTWDNVVLSSEVANRRKADRTPEQAGMKLLKAPRRPEWNPIYSRFARLSARSSVPASWKKFIPNSWGIDDFVKLELIED